MLKIIEIRNRLIPSNLNDIFLLFGIVLVGFSIIVTIIQKHTIASIILIICDLLLLVIYFGHILD